MNQSERLVFFPEKSKGKWGMKKVNSNGYTNSYYNTELLLVDNKLEDIQSYTKAIGYDANLIGYCRDRLDNNYVSAKEYAYCFDYDYMFNEVFVVCYPGSDSWFFKYGYRSEDGYESYNGYSLNSGLSLYSSNYYTIADYVRKMEPRGLSMVIYVSNSSTGAIFLAEKNQGFFEGY